MKFALVLVVLLASAVASAAPASKYFECTNLAGVQEYTVNIDLNNGVASFFDNDAWSTMKLVKTNYLETFPPQVQMIFEGKDANHTGFLRLFFNATRLTVDLQSIYNGKTSSVGHAGCVPSKTGR